ncbi:MAG: methylenetetrahydrofolate reductase [NAD(P)H], partial [Sphingomonadales bacterium]
PAMEEVLWETVTALAPLQPRFVSVTYGAGGGTRERTHNTVIRIQRETALTAAAHLTCVGSPKAEVDDIAARYWAEGVRHIVALRGDPPEGEARYRPHADGYRNAADLVGGLKRIADFEVSVAAYPERHVDSPDWQVELDNLKAKVDAGATRAITQYFFDPDLFLRFRDRVADAGINLPIVPGIMPVTNFQGMVNFSARCGASVPEWLAALFEGLDDQPSTRQLVAVAVSAELCRRLYDEGVKEFHFYTLNRAALTYAICHTLGLRPKGLDE